MKTPALDAPMTEAETTQAFDAWRDLQNFVSRQEPRDMLQILEALSPIVDEVFKLRRTLTDIWKRAEDRHYGNRDVIRPFRRGASPKSTKPPAKGNLLKELGITEEQLNAALVELNLLSPPKGGSGDET